jgi:hypothetical protein
LGVGSEKYQSGGGKAKKKSLFRLKQALVKYPILSGFKPFLALTEVSL